MNAPKPRFEDASHLLAARYARRWCHLPLLIGGLALVLLAACRTTTLQPLPAINLSEPGWKWREGQALWRSRSAAPEIAGEIMLATRPDGRSLVQFTKTPLPLVTAQTTDDRWQVEFIPEKRVFAGRGRPPARIIWLHLARVANGLPPPSPLQFEKLPAGSLRLENRQNGERLIVYLSP